MITNNKKYTLSALIFDIANLIKKYEDNENIQTVQENKLYNISEVLEFYPYFSKYLLTKAIEKGDLKAIWIGHQRHFYKKDLEEYIINHEKINDPEQTLNWRNGELTNQD